VDSDLEIVTDGVGSSRRFFAHHSAAAAIYA
jgi:hypothetical protein